MQASPSAVWTDGAYAPSPAACQTEMPSRRALSARLPVMPEPGKMTTPAGMTESMSSLRREARGKKLSDPLKARPPHGKGRLSAGPRGGRLPVRRPAETGHPVGPHALTFPVRLDHAGRKARAFSRTSCALRLAMSRSGLSRRRSSLKSPSSGASTSGRIPSAWARQLNPSIRAGRPHRRQLRCRDAGSHRAVGRRQGDWRFSAGRLEGLGSPRLELTLCWRSLYILTG